MYKLIRSDNFSSTEYSIPKKRGITALAAEYGRGNDALTLYNRYGQPVAACAWDPERKRYIKLNT